MKAPEKRKASKPKKIRTTINLPEGAHIKLSRLTLKVRASGVVCFKQRLAAAMIDYFDKRPELLKDLAVS